MLTNLLAPWSAKLALGLVIALGLLAWRADAISADRDREKERRVSAELRLDASNASVDRLTAELEALVAEGRMRAERLDNALSQVAEDNAPLVEQAERLERGEIDVTEVEGL